jgi:ABC-type multidrug transport system ATPase subunit
MLLLAFSLCLFFVNEGIGDYKNLEKNILEFQDVERIKVSKYVFMRQYGSSGFRLLFCPSPLSVFFTNSGVGSEITSQVDSGEMLKIYNSFKGKNLFLEKSGHLKDFAGIILLFGSLLALYFGYSSFRHRDFIKMVSGFCGYRPVFFNILISRILLVVLAIIVLTGLGWLLLILHSIALSGIELQYLFNFLVVTITLLVFFFLLGTVVSSLRSKPLALVSMISLWFLLVFLMPGLIGKLVAKRAENITLNYKLEVKKLSVLMKFEKEALEKEGKVELQEEYNPKEIALNNSYWDNEFKSIERVERGMIEEMNDNVRFYHSLSSLLPSTFYISMSNECSSRGYKNFIDFYRYIQALKKKFVRFYLDRLSSEDPDTVVSFINKDENIFHSSSHLPYYARRGTFITLGFIVFLLVLSYVGFKKAVFCYIRPRANELSRHFAKLDSFKLQVRKGESYTLLSNDELIKEQFYLVFSGILRGMPEWENMVSQVNLVDEIDSSASGFVFIGKLEEWPGDIKVGDYLMLLKRLAGNNSTGAEEISILLGIDTIKKKYFGAIDESEKRKAVFAGAKLKESDFYVFDDFARGMPLEFLIEFRKNLRRLKESGDRILYLSNDVLLAPEIGDRIGIMKNGQLLFFVKDSDLRQMNLNEMFFQYFADKK